MSQIERVIPRWTFNFDCEWLHFETFTPLLLSFYHMPNIGSVGYSLGILGFIFNGSFMYDKAPAERILDFIEACATKSTHNKNNKEEVISDGSNNDAVEQPRVHNVQADLRPPTE